MDTSKILEAVVDRTIGSERLIPFRKVRDASIPPGYSKFLHARLVEQYSREGRAAIGHNPVQDALLRTRATEHRFERAGYLELLVEATRFLSRYLRQPQEGLCRWILGEQQVVTVPELSARLQYVADYRYLPLLIDGWVRRRRLTTLSGDDLRTLLPALDARVVATHSRVEIALLARPLFRFFLFGSGTSKLPLELLEGFYREKNLTSFWSEVESNLGGIREIGLKSFVQCFGRPPVVTHPVSPSDTESVEKRSPDVAQIAPDEPVVDQTLPPAVAGLKGIPDLSECISDEQRSLFVNAVFERDAAYYAAVISSLNGLQTWKEAALFLSQFYQTNRLDPFATEVVEFTDIIHKRYAGTEYR